MAKQTRTLTVKVLIHDPLQVRTQLELEESIEIRTDTFVEAASVLTQFHELVQRIRDEQLSK